MKIPTTRTLAAKFPQSVFFGRSQRSGNRPSVAFLAASFAVLGMLGACGGGGGGGAASPHGVFALPGIERLPLGEIRASNEELAAMVAIAEPGSDDSDERHPIIVSKIACNSFVTPCENRASPLDGSVPFTLYTPETDQGESNSLANVDSLLQQIPDSVKLASVQFVPGFVEFYGDDVPFAIVRSAGNTGEQRFATVYRDITEDISEPYRTGAILGFGLNVIEAAESEKLLIVAGYERRRGLAVRHPSSTGCVGVEEWCVHAPFVFELPPGSAEEFPVINGTSGSAPNVAMALASVLAFYPRTSGPDLIRLAKACADPQPALPGLGLANFECMTELDEGGRWRLVSETEYASLISPANLRSLAFPGRTAIAGDFAVDTDSNGIGTVRLALEQPALFSAAGFRAAEPLPKPTARPGLYPIVSVGDEFDAVGGGVAGNTGFFAAAALGQSDGFFGLSPRYGYGGSSTIDVSMGHRNLFLRASRQWSDGTGHLLNAAQGSAVGVSAGGDREIAPGLSVSASIHADRFAGGSAATAFGPVKIGQSPWNRRAEIGIRGLIGENSEYSIAGILGRQGDQSTTQKLSAGMGFRF